MAALVNPLFSALFRPFLDQRDRWFLGLPVLMAGGVFLYFALPFEPSAFWLFFAPLSAGCLFLFRQKPALFVFGGALLAFCLGLNAAQLETKFLAAPMLEEKINRALVTGLLVRAEALPEGSRLTIQDPFIREKPDFRPRFVRIKTETPLDELPDAGATVRLWGPLFPPGERVAPSGYDFRRAAFFKQIGATGFSYGEPLLDQAKESPPFFWDGFFLAFEKARRFFALKVLKRLSEDNAPLTITLLTGGQTGIAEDDMRAMRLSGLSHLLSISGVHVSMIALLLYAPVRALLALFPWMALRWPIKKIAAVFSIFGTILYTILVGADAPTVRSALMAGLVLFAVILDRKALSLRVVALAAMLITLAAPSVVIGPSFQLSFAAVLAMIAAYEKRLDKSGSEETASVLPLAFVFRHGKDIVLTSLIATAATTPFALFHFQSFSFYGVVANMVGIPLTTLWIMPCLLLTYIGAPFGLEGLFLDGAGWGASLLLQWAHLVAAWPFSQIALPLMPLWAFGLFVCGGLWLCLWRGRFRLLGLLPLLGACFYPFFVTPPDILVAPDGKKWAASLPDGRLALYGERAEGFVATQWLQHTNRPEPVSLRKGTRGATEALRCDKESCLWEKGAFSVIFLLEKAAPETIATACASGATAIEAPFLLPESCAAPVLIDAAALQKRGAHALTFAQNGVRLAAARTAWGARPWSVGWANK